jgi:energy-coupling factor transporter ATP-binding protein EcfA2
MEIYNITNLSFTYPKKNKKALSGINIKIKNGEFVTICGKSGCGKTTLLRNLKTILTPHGKREGKIFYCGKLIDKVDERTQALQIGYVLQSPDNQIVTDKVWHELAFGLESLGYDNSTIRLRVAEMASFFGIQEWFHKNVAELSGGQKQLLNLASIMAMQPSVLILDEPTCQLDPIAAIDFIETVKRINVDLGITIIMTEQRLEEIIPLSDRIIVMDEGNVIADGLPQNIGEKLNAINHPMFVAMTTPMRIHAKVKDNLPCPITVKEGRNWIDSFLNKTIPSTALSVSTASSVSPSTIKAISSELSPVSPASSVAAVTAISSSPPSQSILASKGLLSLELPQKDPAVELKNVWFKYEKNMPDVIKGLSLKIRKGQFYCIVGGNGTGKTTALSLISGLYRPYRGKILINGKSILNMKQKDRFDNNLGMLPQNPQVLFVKKTVELDLHEMLSYAKLTKEEKANKVKTILEFTELTGLRFMHPYDLSGGEQQRAALAKTLLLEPKILLLDEPTKGLDAHFKIKLAKMLKELNAKGVTVIMVSHDIEFCAKYSDTCALFFDGSIITAKTTREFFSGNCFYTTATNRMVRHIYEDAIIAEDVIELCQKANQ